MTLSLTGASHGTFFNSDTAKVLLSEVNFSNAPLKKRHVLMTLFMNKEGVVIPRPWIKEEWVHLFGFGMSSDTTGGAASDYLNYRTEMSKIQNSQSLMAVLKRTPQEHIIPINGLNLREWGVFHSKIYVEHNLAFMAWAKEYLNYPNKKDGACLDILTFLCNDEDTLQEKTAALRNSPIAGQKIKFPTLAMIKSDPIDQSWRTNRGLLWQGAEGTFSVKGSEYGFFSQQMTSSSEAEQLVLRLKSRYRPEDCPTTPDGAWLRYLNELVKPAAIPVMLPDPAEGVEAEKPVAEPLALPETKPDAPPPTKGKVRKAKVTGKPVWEGVDPDDIWLRVMLGEVPEADAQGDLRVWPELKTVLMSESPSNRGYTRERKAGAREVAPQSAVMGKLAFMRPDDFRSRVQNSFYPWRHELEARCKRSFPYTLANIHTVEATEWGSVPGLVAGEHRPQGDRLCAVRVIWSSEREADLPDPTKPFSYKHAGEDKTLPFVPRSLMAFPAGWLKRKWGFLGGLYGSPLDPTLLDWWGSNAPPENWLTALTEWLPPKQPYDDIEPYPRDVIEALIARLS